MKKIEKILLYFNVENARIFLDFSKEIILLNKIIYGKISR